MQEIIVRKFGLSDRGIVREISYETSFLEQPRLFVDDRDIVADALTAYFTDCEPGSCFVAESQGEVVGYLTGTVDMQRKHQISLERVIPRVIRRFVFKGLFFQPKTRALFLNAVMGFGRGEFNVSDLGDHFPAEFHINIKKNFRGRGIGRELINQYTAFLVQKNIKGVQARTMSEEAKHFFLRLGFHVLSQTQRTYLKYCLGYDLIYYVLGKRWDKSPAIHGGDNLLSLNTPRPP